MTMCSYSYMEIGISVTCYNIGYTVIDIVKYKMELHLKQSGYVYYVV